MIISLPMKEKTEPNSKENIASTFLINVCMKQCIVCYAIFYDFLIFSKNLVNKERKELSINIFSFMKIHCFIRKGSEFKICFTSYHAIKCYFIWE